MDLVTLLVWLSKNRSIRHLSLGKNFNNIKSKWVKKKSQTIVFRASNNYFINSIHLYWMCRNVAQVLNNLVLMIQEEDSVSEAQHLHVSSLHSSSFFLSF